MRILRKPKIISKISKKTEVISREDWMLILNEFEIPGNCGIILKKFWVTFRPF